MFFFQILYSSLMTLRSILSLESAMVRSRLGWVETGVSAQDGKGALIFTRHRREAYATCLASTGVERGQLVERVHQVALNVALRPSLPPMRPIRPLFTWLNEKARVASRLNKWVYKKPIYCSDDSRRQLTSNAALPAPMSALLKAFSPRDDKASAAAGDDKPAEASQSGDGDAKKGSSSSERRSSSDRRGSSDRDRDRDRDRERGDDRRKRRSRSRERRLVARAV